MKLNRFYGWLLRVCLLQVMTLFLKDSFGQAASPYSRFGLGYIHSSVFSANKAMGDLAAPYASANNINFANPASYASLTRTTIEAGVNIDGAAMRVPISSSKDSLYHATQGGVSHFVVAFAPAAKHASWTICAGILPFSNINYSFVQNYNDSTNLGVYRQIYTGKGSLYQTFVGGAVKIKGFAIGANAGYLFGKLEYQKDITFPDTAYAFSTRNVTNLNVKSFVYNIGVQYIKQLYADRNNPDERTKLYMVLGAYGSGGMKMNARLSNYWERFDVNVNTGVTTVDTPSGDFNKKVSIHLPLNLGLGAMFGNERFWLIGADFKFMNWSKYTSPLQNAGLSDSWRFSLGAQITPKYDDLDKRRYFNRVSFRLGTYIGKSEINFAGKQLNEVAGTVGFGFPFKAVAHLNIAGEFGTRGGSDKSVLRENFYRFNFSLVLNDIWFIKRKFD